MGAPDDDFDAIWAEKKKTLRFTRGRNLRPDQILAYYGVELSKNDIKDFEASKSMISTTLNVSKDGTAENGSQKTSTTANFVSFSLLEAFKNDTVATIKTDISKLHSIASQSIMEEAEKSQSLKSPGSNASRECSTSESQRTAASTSMAFSLLDAFKNDTVATVKTDISKRHSVASQSIMEETGKSQSLMSPGSNASRECSTSESQRTAASNSMAFSLLDAFKNDTVATLKTNSSKLYSIASESIVEEPEKSETFNSTVANETEKSVSSNSTELDAFKELSLADLQKTSTTVNSMSFSLLDAFKNDTVATVKTDSSKRNSIASQSIESGKSETSNSTLVEELEKSNSVNSTNLDVSKQVSMAGPQKASITSNSMSFSLLEAFKNDTIATPKSVSSKRSSAVSQSTSDGSQKIASKSLNFTSLDAFRDESMKTIVSDASTEDPEGLQTTPKSQSLQFSQVHAFRDETMATALNASTVSEVPGNRTVNIGTQTSTQSTPSNLKPKTPPNSRLLSEKENSNLDLFSKISDENTESEPMEVDPTPKPVFVPRKSVIFAPSTSSVLSSPVPIKDSTHQSVEVMDERRPTVLPSGSSESVVASGPGDFKVPPLPVNKLRLSVLSNRPHFMEPTQSSLARVNSPMSCPKTPPASRSHSDEGSKTPQFPRRSVAVPRIVSEQNQGNRFHPNLDLNSPRFTAFRRSTALKTIANYETPPKSNKRCHAITPNSATKETSKFANSDEQENRDDQNRKTQSLAKSNALNNLMQNYGTPSPARVPKKILRSSTSCAREVTQEVTVLNEVDRRQRKEQVLSPISTAKTVNEDSTMLSSLESADQEEFSEAERKAKVGIAKLTINNGPQSELITNLNLDYEDDDDEPPKGSGLNDSVYSVHTHTPARTGRCIALSVKKTASPIIPDSEDEFEKENSGRTLEMTNVFDPPDDGESLPKPLIVKSQQKYVLHKRQLIKPEQQTVDCERLRRSSRTRLKPCRSWLNEQPVYKYGPDMTRTLVGVTEVEIKNKQYQKYLTASPVTLNDRRIAEQKRRKKQKEVRKRHWEEQRLEDDEQLNQSGIV